MGASWSSSGGGGQLKSEVDGRENSEAYSSAGKASETCDVARRSEMSFGGGGVGGDWERCAWFGGVVFVCGGWLADDNVRMHSMRDRASLVRDGC